LTLFLSPAAAASPYKEVAIGYYASQAIDNCVASITIFSDLRYPNYSSAQMGKQTVLSRIKNNHFDTKGSNVFEDAAKSPNIVSSVPNR